MRPTALTSALVLFSALAFAQDGPELRSWTPPPYWMPFAADSSADPVARRTGMPVREAQTAAGVEPLAITTPLPYVGIDPCRQYDSRSATPLLQATPRSVLLTGAPCGIPATAQAVALNLTIFNITGAASNGVFRIDVVSPPVTAWINYPPTEAQRANAGVVALTGAGEIVVQVNQGGGSVDFVVDVFGYYAPVGIVNTLNTLSGDVTLAAGTNVTITPAGQTLTIAAAGAAGPTGATGATGPTGSTGPPGPTGWALTGNAGTNPATNFLGTTDNQALELRVNSARALRLEQVTSIVGATTYVGANVLGGSSNNSITLGVTLATIAGGGGTANGTDQANTVTDVGGTVGGGRGNRAGDNAGTLDDRGFATVGGGAGNVASGNRSTIAGGVGNAASGIESVVAGGAGNTASATYSTVAGGSFNTASGLQSAVAGGTFSTASATDSTVAGGEFNTASGLASAVAGGASNTAGGSWSFVAGQRAVVRDAATSGDADGDEGTFVWADSQATDFISTGPNQFLIRAAGGVGIGTADPMGFLLAVNGTAAKPGGGAWTTLSDARLKRDIRPLDGTLDRLLALRGVSFEYIDPAAIHELPGTRTGMVAQEVERVFPDWVSEGPDGYRRLTYRGFEALAVEAFRDLRREKDAQIEGLEAALETQRVKSEALMAVLEKQHAEIALLREGIELLKADRAEPLRGNRR